MDITGILKPEELPFDVPEDLELAINDLLDAWERDEMADIDCCLDEVHGAARGLSTENDAWVREYYIRGGWRAEAGGLQGSCDLEP